MVSINGVTSWIPIVVLQLSILIVVVIMQGNTCAIVELLTHTNECIYT